MAIGGSQPFGLNDLRVVNSAGTADADVPSASELVMTPLFESGELRGDDSIVAVAARLIGLNWSLAYGGLNLDAAEIMLGYTKSATGTTPNQSEWIRMTAAKCMPYFGIHGKALGADCTDAQRVYVRKAKVMDIGDIRLANGQFQVSNLSGIAVSDGTGIVDIIQEETATTLPTVP